MLGAARQRRSRRGLFRNQGQRLVFNCRLFGSVPPRKSRSSFLLPIRSAVRCKLCHGEICCLHNYSGSEKVRVLLMWHGAPRCIGSFGIYLALCPSPCALPSCCERCNQESPMCQGVRQVDMLEICCITCVVKNICPAGPIYAESQPRALYIATARQLAGFERKSSGF